MNSSPPRSLHSQSPAPPQEKTPSRANSPAHQQQQQQQHRHPHHEHVDNYHRDDDDDKGEKRSHVPSDPGTYNNEELVLIMDSNMNYVDKRFWKSTFKLKCGRADMLERTLNRYDLTNAKHIIIGTGTNDPQYGHDAATTFKNLVDATQKLVALNGPKVHLAQLPPRNDEHGSTISDLNTLIKSDTPTNVDIINHENITLDDLFDSKHIRRNRLGKFVINMKDHLRKFNTKRHTVEHHQQHDRRDGNHEQFHHRIPISTRNNTNNEHSKGLAEQLVSMVAKSMKEMNNSVMKNLQNIVEKSLVSS